MWKMLELRARKTIRNFGMLAGGEHVLVGVSGGPDSVALLVCLHRLAPELRLTLTAAHLNHGIRGIQAEEDARFVSSLSAKLGIQCLTAFVDIKALAKSEKRNLEELARERRYDFLRNQARKVGARKIAVGHTMNDQAETALFRFIRGSGIEGLSAIHPVNGTVIRPLLECTRDSVLEYLREEGFEYREDETNRDLRYSRNRLRQEIIPLLERDFNPRLIATLARQALVARETWSLMESRASDVFAAIHSRREDSVTLRVADILKEHRALQKEVLRQAIRESLGSLRGISSAHITGVLGLLSHDMSGATVQLPRGGLALRQFEELVLSNGTAETPGRYEYALPVPGQSLVPEAHVKFVCSIRPGPDLRNIKGSCATKAYLDPTNLHGHLTVRSRGKGDRYGGPGRRKVKKMLIDSKIPLSRRPTLPMIVSGTDVIWIPGFRPARGFEVKPDSQECVVIEMIRWRPD